MTLTNEDNLKLSLLEGRIQNKESQNHELQILGHTKYLLFLNPDYMKVSRPGP
jgi:hypothetical protein